jgi:hypothetical protein
MHIKTVLTALLQVCIEDEMKFDDYQHVFAEIVNLGEYTLNVLDVPKSSTPKFQFDAHLVIPLHMVGHKCRDRAIRKRAISLLLCHARREGVWDSTLAGRVAEWAMEVEEEHLENGRVPGWARIHGVTLDRDRQQPRRAILTCEQRLGPLSKGVVTRHKSIIW